MTRQIGLLFCLTVLAASTLAARGGATELVFERFNGTYEDPIREIPPVRHGALTIQLDARRQVLTLHSNRLELEPIGDGRHQGRLTFSFSGFADLAADVGVGAVAKRFEDKVALPRQTRILEGVMKMTEDEDGFLVTPVELPRRVMVEIDSAMARQLVGWCDGMPLLAFALPDCRVLERDLAQIEVPLPPPGKSFHIDSSQLTAKERKSLSRYLKQAAKR